MSEQNSVSTTPEFIHLVKCITEYYGLTKTKEDKKELQEAADNSLNSQLDEASKLLGSLTAEGFGIDDITIDIPTDVDDAIKKTFLSQLKKFE